MPGENIHDWSTTAADNDAADTLINWREGMPRAAVNDSARSLQAALAKHRDLRNGSIVTTGTANAQVFASGVGYTAIPTGLRALLKISITNTGPATLNMDSIGDVAIKKVRGGDLAGGELKLDCYADVLYDGTNWILLQDSTAGSSLVGESIASGSATIDFTFDTAAVLAAAYDEFLFVITNLVPTVNGANLYMQVSTDGGVSWKSSAGDYHYNRWELSGGVLFADGSTTTPFINLINSINSSPSCPLAGEIRLFAPYLAKFNPIWWVKTYTHSVGTVQSGGGGGYHYAAAGIQPITAVRFYLSTGTMASGNFFLHGVKH